MKDESLISLERELRAALNVVNDWHRKIYAKKIELIGNINFSIGDWKCDKSPIGECVYDTVNDPYHDDCIFCHDSEERK